MLPLALQIRLAAFQAQEAVCWLRGEAPPDRLGRLAAEGWEAREGPGTIATATARITEALALLEGLEPDARDAGAELAISRDRPDGLAFDLTGEPYARGWTQPQSHFHVVGADALLRNQSIATGNANDVPPMFAYLRTGEATWAWAAGARQHRQGVSRSASRSGPAGDPPHASRRFASRRNRCRTNSV